MKLQALFFFENCYLLLEKDFAIYYAILYVVFHVISVIGKV